MYYRLEVKNKYNYGHSTFKFNSLPEVEQFLKNNVFDGILSLYEESEIKIPYKHLSIFDFKIKNDSPDFIRSMLYKNAYINKEYCEPKNSEK